jgi:hypothetical protein
VYLVTPSLCKLREGGCVPIPLSDDGKPALAAVAPAAPCARSGGAPFQSSSFVVLDRDHVPESPVSTPSGFRYTFAHEFFHVVENALNLEAQGGACLDDVSTDVVNSWLVEASAEWAAWAWFPDDGRPDRDGLFRRFQSRGPEVSLRSQDGLHPYSAYLYPFFVQQEGGGRARFLDVWTKGQSARFPAQLDDRLDAALPFAEHFRDFAVRNLNTTAAELPGDPLPLAQRHQALDTAIPENFQPRIGPPTTLAAPTELSRPASIAALSTYYTHLVVGDEARWVRVDFGPLSSSGFVQLDVVANVHGTWERRRLPGPVFEFCRDDAGDDIGELYVIASHHGRDAKAEGTWVAQTKTSCPSGWTGVITYDEVHDDFSSVTDANGTTVEEDHVQHRQRWVLGGTTPGPQGDAVDVAWDGTWQKHYSLRHAPSSGCVGQVTYGRVSGAGVGSGTDRITFVPIPGGWQTTPDFSIQQLEGTEDHFSQICTGASASSSEPIPLLVDQLFTAVFAAEDLALLQPATPEQKSFTGTKVLTHLVEPRPGGQSVLDVTIGWTLRKR